MQEKNWLTSLSNQFQASLMSLPFFFVTFDQHIVYIKEEESFRRLNSPECWIQSLFSCRLGQDAIWNSAKSLVPPRPISQSSPPQLLTSEISRDRLSQICSASRPQICYAVAQTAAALSELELCPILSTAVGFSSFSLHLLHIHRTSKNECVRWW